MAFETMPYIDGRWVAGDGDAIGVENPATEEIFTEVQGASAAQFEQAIGAARASFDSGGWARRPRPERIAVLHALVEYLRTQRETIIERAMSEVGTPRRLAELLHCDTPLRHAGETLELYGRLPERHNNEVGLEELFGPARRGGVGTSFMEYEPVGVVAAISAYNAPLYINMWKVIPALAVGCSMVLRPNALTPLAALVLAEAADAVGIPPGVLNVVAERGVDGAVMLGSHRHVDMMSFTGSDVIGAEIMRNGAGTFKRLLLELGGKSIQMYLPDSLHLAPRGGLDVLGGIAGQGCSLPTRMLVPSSSRDEVAEMVAAAAKGLRPGDPRDPSVNVGPVISAAQLARCEHYVAAAVDAGGRVVSGGARCQTPSGGHFFEPTVLSVPDHRNPAAVDEIFGPVLSVIGYDDVDQAVEIANDSEYGLAGIVYAKDPWEGYQIAKRVRTGSIGVNGGLFTAWVSAGGIKRSGIGRERGVEGLRAYQQQKHIVVHSQV